MVRRLGRGVWVSQLVKRPTLSFSSGHDLMVCEFEPHIGSALTVQSLLGILSVCVSLSLCLSLSLSLSVSAPPLLVLSLSK